jgi:hypothetical protein
MPDEIYHDCTTPGCGDEVADARWQLGYRTCLGCGSPAPKRTIVPLHKQGYMLVSRREVQFASGKTAGWDERSDN